jgi:hypothetical protein
LTSEASIRHHLLRNMITEDVSAIRVAEPPPVPRGGRNGHHLVSIRVAGARYVGVGATSRDAVEDLVQLLAGHLERLIGGAAGAPAGTVTPNGEQPTTSARGGTGRTAWTSGAPRR